MAVLQHRLSDSGVSPATCDSRLSRRRSSPLPLSRAFAPRAGRPGSAVGCWRSERTVAHAGARAPRGGLGRQAVSTGTIGRAPGRGACGASPPRHETERGSREI